MGPAAGYSWAAAGGKPFREEEEEEEADVDYWKLLADLPTCWPAAWKTPAQCGHSYGTFNGPASAQRPAPP